MASMTRAEHLRWAKDRALEYVEAGDLDQAFASLASDLGKHRELDWPREVHAKIGLALTTIASSRFFAVSRSGASR